HGDIIGNFLQKRSGQHGIADFDSPCVGESDLHVHAHIQTGKQERGDAESEEHFQQGKTCSPVWAFHGEPPVVDGVPVVDEVVSSVPNAVASVLPRLVGSSTN